MTALPTTFSVFDRVEAARQLHPDDFAAALKYVEKHAIEDIMWLLERSRVQARYEHTKFPHLPEIFQRQRQRGGDQIWEGSHNWTNKAVPDGTAIEHLDTPGAFLNAFTCHLPIGQLEHDDEGVFDKKRSGAYLITPPAWEHGDLPNPLGNRKLKGDLWVMRPTLQLLNDCAAKGLCEAPVLHESWTGRSSEGLLKPLRGWLSTARMEAIDAGDKLAVEGVKALYSLLISTMGDSRANFELRRADWRHSVRAQAFSNLWRRAHRIHLEGGTLYRVYETDAIHVATGAPWRSLWSEGRALNQMRLKDAYTLGQEG